MNIIEWLDLYEVLNANHLPSVDLLDVLAESKRKCNIVFPSDR